MATKKIKVSQKTIDQIKNLGMTKALAAGKTVRSAEFQEGLRRMYGSKKVDAARYSGKNKSVPVGGVMGTSKNNKVMGGSSVKSTMKPAKKTAAKKVTKSGGLGAGVSVPVSMRTKTAKKSSMFNKKVPRYTK
jgi:hypothetical protein